MKTDREALEEALVLLGDPEHWTQWAYGRDAQGQKMDLDDLALAERRCAVGALLTVGSNEAQVFRLLWSVVKSFDSPSPINVSTRRLMEFNDSHSYEDVILALKRGLDHLE